MFIHCDITGADSRNFNRIHVICNNICLYRYSVRSFLTSTETTVPVDMVAFYAYLSYNTPAAVAHHIIAFDKVVTNVGNACHSHSEKFIAPKSGLNVFIWTIRLLRNNSYYTTQLHNCLKWIYLNLIGIDGSLTGTAVVQVNLSDNVLVRTGPRLYRGSIVSNLDDLSLFAGWILI